MGGGRLQCTRGPNHRALTGRVAVFQIDGYL